MTELKPLGDRAFVARFATEDESIRWAAAVRDQGIAGILDIVTAHECVAVFADPDRIDLSRLEHELRGMIPQVGVVLRERLVVIPVLYDGPDLAEVAERTNLSPAEVVKAHSKTEYRVFAIGFLPGFPYAGDLPESLRGLPRRFEPRLRVPAGSVAMAGRQTGIYPRES